MLITMETDYALRILRGLSNGERQTIKALCEAQQVPQQFAYKIIKKLAKANLVRSTRGVEGGCELIADLRTVSLYDLLEVIEQGRQICACMNSSYGCTWVEKTRGRCMVHHQLAEVQKKLDGELKMISLRRLIFGKE